MYIQTYSVCQGLSQDAVPGAKPAAQEGAAAQGEQTALLPETQLGATAQSPERRATGNLYKCLYFRACRYILSLSLLLRATMVFLGVYMMGDYDV